MRELPINSELSKVAAHSLIDSLDESEGFVLIVKKKTASRSSSQLNLKWKWMAQLSNEAVGLGFGWGSREWNDYLKGRFMHDLLIEQDSDWRFYFDGANETYVKQGWRDNEYEYYRLVGSPLETKDLTVDSMGKYMTRIQQHCASEFGVVLESPESLGW